MFPKSSQRRNWMYKDEGELQSLRVAANKKFVDEFKSRLDVSIAAS